MATILEDIAFLGLNDYELHDTVNIVLTPDGIHAVFYLWRYQNNWTPDLCVPFVAISRFRPCSRNGWNLYCTTGS